MSRVVSCRQVLGVTGCCPAETESALLRVLPQREFEACRWKSNHPWINPLILQLLKANHFHEPRKFTSARHYDHHRIVEVSTGYGWHLHCAMPATYL